MSKTVIIVDEQLFNKLLHKIDLINDKVDNINMAKDDGLKEKWYMTDDVCKLLKVSRRTLQNLRDSKAIPFRKNGRKIYYKASEIEAYLENIQ